MAALPPIAALVAASTLPTCLGYWRSEYGVSYAYGGAMFLTGALVFPTTASLLASLHATALMVYGVRLNAFLLYRELYIPRFIEVRERIEQKAKDNGNRLARTPFVLGCSLLYFCMAAPMMVTAQAAIQGGVLTGIAGAMWAGLVIAALGDFTKTWVKAKKGTDALVTEGVFKILRHPNYTGEIILWTSSMVLAFATAVLNGTLAANAPWLAASVVGMLGINFVLTGATGGLEKRQAEKYGETEEYKKWVKSSWSGPMIKKK